MGDSPINPKSRKGNELVAASTPIAIAPDKQMLFIELETERDGIGMGVLSDGTPYLHGRGLATLCGVSNGRIVEMGQVWNETSKNSMAEGVKKILRERNVMPDRPFIEVLKSGRMINAYPELICLAVLEYYAFETNNPIARRNYALLAGKALRDLIYAEVGYDPSVQSLGKWRQFHDRLSLTFNAVPAGYFCIFKEIADIIIHLGQMGLMIESTFVPDISVGKCWGTHWSESGFDAMFGPRIKFEHNYPEYFPQAASNPQVPWCYPEAALGEFRRWMREDYIGDGKFKRYLDGQVAKKALPPSFAQLAVAAYEDKAPKRLPPR